MSKTGYYNKNRTPSEPYIPWHKLEPITETLLQFCIEHGYPENSTEIESIKNCLKAVREKDIPNIITNFKKITLGKEGFNEWYPDVTYTHENEVYVQSIFDALIKNWVENINHVKNT